MEFTPEAARDLLRKLAELGEDLRGMQVFTPAPKGATRPCAVPFGRSLV